MTLNCGRQRGGEVIRVGRDGPWLIIEHNLAEWLLKYYNALYGLVIPFTSPTAPTFLGDPHLPPVQ